MSDIDTLCGEKPVDELLDDLKERLGDFQVPHQEAFLMQKETSKERTSLTPKGMVYIPAGTFLIGSTECGEDAKPQHECETEGFYIDRTPVTNAQFRQFVEDTGYITEIEKEEQGPVWLNGERKMMQGICWKNPHHR